MKKNIAGQKIVVYAYYDGGGATPGAAVTGDAANITCKISKDGAAASATNDTNPTEIEDGYYAFDATQAESNADTILVLPESSTANVVVIGVPQVIYTRSQYFSDLSITSGGVVSSDVSDKTGFSLAASQTFNLTGNITGNLSGSVGSVSGNVGGNVSGSVGSISGVTFPTNFGDLTISATTGYVDLGFIKGVDAITQLGSTCATASSVSLNAFDWTGITVGAVSDKAGFSLAANQSGVTIGTVNAMAGTITTLDALDAAQDLRHDTTQSAIGALNNIAATDIVSAGPITTLSGAVVNVDTVDTCTTNTDMRGTDNALLAVSAPANFAALGINVSGHVSRVTLVDTTTTNTDMRGTDLANTVTPPSVSAIRTEIDSNSTQLAAILEDTGTTIPAQITTAQNDLDLLTGTDGATLATLQPNYAPAKAGDQMDLVNAPNATAVTAIQSGLSTFDHTTHEVTVGTNNDKTGYSLTTAERSAIAVAVEAAIMNEGDSQAVIAAIVAAIDAADIDLITASAIAAEVKAQLDAAHGAGLWETADVSALATTTQLNARTLLAAEYATAENQTTILNRLGAFTGTGVNTVLGFFRAMFRNDAALPSDIGGNYAASTMSLEANKTEHDATQTAVSAVSTSGDWTDDEKDEIRYRLGIDGDTSAPLTNSPNLEIGGAAGSGSDLVTLTLKDGLGNVVSDAEVWISTDLAGTSVTAGTLRTNDLGKVTFMLDHGTSYYRWADKSGVNFTNPTQFTAVRD